VEIGDGYCLVIVDVKVVDGVGVIMGTIVDRCQVCRQRRKQRPRMLDNDSGLAFLCEDDLGSADAILSLVAALAASSATPARF
jgi:hypothetical protein